MKSRWEPHTYAEDWFARTDKATLRAGQFTDATAEPLIRSINGRHGAYALYWRICAGLRKV